jgi:hypothetical protein
VKSEMLAELHVRTVQQWKKIIFSLHFKKWAIYYLTLVMYNSMPLKPSPK